MFLLVPAYPGCPGSKAVKRSLLLLSVFSCTVLFVSISQVIGCEDRLRNDLYCVEWGVKLYSNQNQTLNGYVCMCVPACVGVAMFAVELLSSQMYVMCMCLYAQGRCRRVSQCKLCSHLYVKSLHHRLHLATMLTPVFLHLVT